MSKADILKNLYNQSYFVDKKRSDLVKDVIGYVSEEAVVQLNITEPQIV